MNEVSNADKTTDRCYDEDLMRFAHTLHFLSPKAYKFARKTLCLLCESTLRSKQSVKGEPGWTAESFVALNADPKKTDCVVIMDAINLKSSLQ